MAESRKWHDVYPKPRTDAPPALTAEELLPLLQSGSSAGVDFLLIDTRRTDHEGGTIRGSLNLPAQSLYPSLPVLLRICQSLPRLRQVIFYCGEAPFQESGRGTRAAGWFGELLADHGVSEFRSVILEGGTAGWVRGGPEMVKWVEDYDETAWKSP